MMMEKSEGHATLKPVSQSNTFNVAGRARAQARAESKCDIAFRFLALQPSLLQFTL